MLKQLTPEQMDFDKGFGVGGLGRYVEEQPIPSQKDSAACVVCKDAYPLSHLSNGACPNCSTQCDFCKGFFPRAHLMSASLGRACEGCYDDASDRW